MVEILKAVDIINQSVQYFSGQRNYLSTGDLNISTITNLEKVTFENKPSRANLEVQKGDIIVARMQETLKVKVISKGEEDIIVSTGFLVLRPKKKANKQYLNQIFKSSFFQGEKDRLCSGATQKAINNSNFKKIRIPLPSPEIQQKIANVLDRADRLIQLNQELIKKYNKLAQSIFFEMFGDPVLNPKKWPRTELGNLGHNLDSRRVPVKKSDRDKMRGSIPYYGATGIVDFINKSIFSGKHLLIAEDGKNLVNRKKPIAWIVEGDFWVNNHAHILQYNGSMNLTYLCFHLNHMDISNYVTGIDQFKLNRGNLDRLLIMTPELGDQNKFEKKVESIQQQKELTQKALLKSEELLGSLLQKAFKGELIQKEDYETA